MYPIYHHKCVNDPMKTLEKSGLTSASMFVTEEVWVSNRKVSDNCPAYPNPIQ